MKIGIFYGSTTGNTGAAAQAIKEEFDKKQPGMVELHDVKTADLKSMEGYDLIMIGCPTWNVGELQEDWKAQFPSLPNVNFSGKKVAIFGVGDADGYINNFMDALGILGDVVVQKGGEIYGFWPTDDYNFVQSEGVVDGHFLGLALDDDNESHKSRPRVNAWCQQLMAELGI